MVGMHVEIVGMLNTYWSGFEVLLISCQPVCSSFEGVALLNG